MTWSSTPRGWWRCPHCNELVDPADETTSPAIHLDWHDHVVRRRLWEDDAIVHDAAQLSAVEHTHAVSGPGRRARRPHSHPLTPVAADIAGATDLGLDTSPGSPPNPEKPAGLEA